MRRRVVLAIGIMLAAAPAEAAAQWGEAPAIELGADRSATCLRDAGGGRIAALAKRGGRFGAELYRVGDDALAADGETLLGRSLDHCAAVAAADSGAAVVAASERGRRRRPEPPRLMVAVRDAGGTFGPAIEMARLKTAEAGFDPVVAAGPDGSIVVAWRELYDSGRWDAERLAIRVARRPPGGRFGRVETLVARARGDIVETGLAAAVDGAGRATVAWARPRPPRRHGTIDQLSDIEVVSAASGASFGAPQRLARDVQDVAAVTLAVTPGGQALLAHDGGERIRVYERSTPGAPFAPGAALADAPFLTHPRPVVALAADGSAVVAWHAGNAIEAVVRSGAGAFGPVALLQRPGKEDEFGSGTLFAGVGGPVDDADRLRVVAAPGGGAAVGWLAPAPPSGAAVAGRVAVATAGTFAPAFAIGGAVRDVDAVLPRAGAAPAGVWADNLSSAFDPPLPIGDGRLHLARAAPAAASPPAPAVTVSARPQRLHHGDPLVVDAVCAAACDLRATIAARRSRGEADYADGGPPAPAVATGGRADAGPVRLLVRPRFANHVAPPGGGVVRVRVRVTARDGTDVYGTDLRTRVQRRPIPPLRPPLDVRARRADGAVIVTWRTAAAARRMQFLAYTRRTRGRRQTPQSAFGQVRGRGQRRFRLRLAPARGMRWVVLLGLVQDPPFRRRTVVVPIAG